jgi:ABC-type multidrug transport system ATPase subunit
LTVRETLEFARDSLLKLKQEDFTPEMRKFFAQALVQGQDPFLEYILTVLALKDIEHHVVGTGETGISKDDRNRLTTAEVALGTYSVMLYDQPCLGQESLATYELVSLLRVLGRFQQCSAVMSLVQVSPEVFDLFDRVILLGEGQILYQGPGQDVLHYFDRLGYVALPSSNECNNN